MLRGVLNMVFCNLLGLSKLQCEKLESKSLSTCKQFRGKQMNNIKRPLKSRRYMYVYLNVRIHLICKSGLTVDSYAKRKGGFYMQELLVYCICNMYDWL